MSEGVVERLERLANRIEVLLAEHERLRDSEATVAVPERAAESGGEERARELEQRERTVEERVRAVTARELGVVRRARELAARERELESAAERAAPEPPPQPPPAKVVAIGESPAAGYNLRQLEQRVAEHAEEYPDRYEDWSSYLFFLREYADFDGRLPSSFDYLVEEVFAELL